MKPVVGVLDLGVGNVTSVVMALDDLGSVAAPMSASSSFAGLDGLILPGVGSFGAAVDSLDAQGLRGGLLACAADGVPLLGICLGMQLLFDHSEEAPSASGLGLIPGAVVRLGDSGPRIGWGRVTAPNPERLSVKANRIWPEGAFFYFNHNFAVVPADDADIRLVTTDDGVVPAMVERGNVSGVQFHPERSQLAGCDFLESWLVEKVYGVRA